MLELFITSKDFFSVYFSDLNVPTAYIILTISIFFICWRKHIPLIRTFFLWIFSGFGVATLLDAVYDYQVKIFLHTMSLGEGLIFLVIPYSSLCFNCLYMEIRRKKEIIIIILSYNI